VTAFCVTREHAGTVAVVTVHGAIDLLTGHHVVEAVEAGIAGDGTGLLLDYTDVSFIDSTAVAMLWHTRNRMARGHRPFAVVCASPRVLRVLRLTSFTTAVRVFATRDDALRWFG
jgi:anti-sigma B factor antagonist